MAHPVVPRVVEVVVAYQGRRAAAPTQTNTHIRLYYAARPTHYSPARPPVAPAALAAPPLLRSIPSALAKVASSTLSSSTTACVVSSEWVTPPRWTDGQADRSIATGRPRPDRSRPHTHGRHLHVRVHVGIGCAALSIARLLHTEHLDRLLIYRDRLRTAVPDEHRHVVALHRQQPRALSRQVAPGRGKVAPLTHAHAHACERHSWSPLRA